MKSILILNLVLSTSTTVASSSALRANTWNDINQVLLSDEARKLIPKPSSGGSSSGGSSGSSGGSSGSSGGGGGGGGGGNAYGNYTSCTELDCDELDYAWFWNGQRAYCEGSECDEGECLFSYIYIYIYILVKFVRATNRRAM